MLGTLHRTWARLRGAVRPETADDDFVDELRAHLDLAVDDLISQGHSPREARRLARVQLGNVSLLREDRRALLGLPWLGTFWLDIKLGLRMLRKSWGLTLVGGLAMSITMSVALVVFWGLEAVFAPTLPFEEGGRIVALQTWDEQAAQRVHTPRVDFERWRDHLRSVEQISAFHGVDEALDAGSEAVTAVRAARITADGLRLPRIEPVLGRLLVADDEDPSAEPVAVISHELWQHHWSGRSDVIGSTVSLLGGVHTIVGVMPPEFSFPVHHELWTALRRDDRTTLPTAGPEAAVFGRRADGASLARVQAEVSSLGVLEPTPERNDVAEAPDPSLVARAVPYTFAMTGDFDRSETAWVVRLVLLLMILLLVPPCANIAILVYARIVNRQQEFASRLALGASRSRIVSQVFLEVLVLALVAGGAALGVTTLIVQSLGNLMTQSAGGRLPFWIDFGLSARTVLFAGGLACFAALIAGVLPALQATGRRSGGFASLGQRSSMKLGPTWSLLVIGQVALTLAALPSAIEMAWGTLRDGVLGPGFPAERYVMAQVHLDPLRLEQARLGGRDDEAARQRYGQLENQLFEVISEQAEIEAVASAAAPPGAEPWAWFSAVDTSPRRAETEPLEAVRRQARFNSVGPQWFDLLEQSLLTGRGFSELDGDSAAHPIVVSQTFARLLFGDRNPLGENLSYRSTPALAPPGVTQETIHQIVGVVEDRPRDDLYGTVYHPLRPSAYAGSVLTVRTRAAAEEIDDLLRQLIGGLHPGLVVDETSTLAALYRAQQTGNNVGASALALVTLSVLLLSAAGIYALTSFTLRQRRREIGIRAALGAQPTRLLTAVFRRVLLQISIGAVIGCGVAALVGWYLPIRELGGADLPAAVPLAAVSMIGVALLAAAGPARRGLRLDPVEELRQG